MTIVCLEIFHRKIISQSLQKILIPLLIEVFICSRTLDDPLPSWSLCQRRIHGTIL